MVDLSKSAVLEMNENLVQKNKALLSLMKSKEARKINPRNFDEVVKYVYATFEYLVLTIKSKIKEVADLDEGLAVAECDEQRRLEDFEYQIKEKQGSLDQFEKLTEESRLKNEALRDELHEMKELSKASHSTFEMQLAQQLKQDQEAEDRREMECIVRGLEQVKTKMKQRRREIEDVSKEVKQLEQEKQLKIGELQKTRQEQAKSENDDEMQLDKLNSQISIEFRSADQLRMEIDHLKKRINDSSYVQEDKTMMKVIEAELNDKLKELDGEIKELSAKKIQVQNCLVNLADDRRRFQTNLIDQEKSLETLKQKLEDIKMKIAAEIEKRNVASEAMAGKETEFKNESKNLHN